MPILEKKETPGENTSGDKNNIINFPEGNKDYASNESPINITFNPIKRLEKGLSFIFSKKRNKNHRKWKILLGNAPVHKIHTYKKYLNHRDMDTRTDFTYRPKSKRMFLTLLLVKLATSKNTYNKIKKAEENRRLEKISFKQYGDGNLTWQKTIKFHRGLLSNQLRGTTSTLLIPRKRKTTHIITKGSETIQQANYTSDGQISSITHKTSIPSKNCHISELTSFDRQEKDGVRTVVKTHKVNLNNRTKLHTAETWITDSQKGTTIHHKPTNVLNPI